MPDAATRAPAGQIEDGIVLTLLVWGALQLSQAFPDLAGLLVVLPAVVVNLLVKVLRNYLDAPLLQALFGNAALLSIVFVVTAGLGCASYNAAPVIAGADAYQGATTLASEECDALREAAAALVDPNGPDSAVLWLGKAEQLKTISRGLAEHAVQCDEVVERPAMGVGTFGRIRAAFSASWANARDVAQ